MMRFYSARAICIRRKEGCRQPYCQEEGAKKQRQKRLDERLRVQQVPLAEPTGELVVMQSNGHTYTAGHTVLARLGNATSSRGARYVHATSDMGFTSQVIPQL